MRSIYLSLSLLFFVLANRTNAQIELLGKWEAFCPIEPQNSASMRYCSICTSEKHERMGIIVNGFEAEFKKDSVHISNLGTSSQTVPYKWNEQLRSLDFNYQNKEYSFVLLHNGEPDTRILKDKSCLLVILNRKETKD